MTGGKEILWWSGPSLRSILRLKLAWLSSLIKETLLIKETIFTSIDIKIIRRSTNRIHKIIWWENLLLISGDLMRNGWRWTELCVPANSQDRHDTPLCAGVLAAWVKRQTFLFTSWRLHTWLLSGSRTVLQNIHKNSKHQSRFFRKQKHQDSRLT